jgi:hypothetical protein
MWISPDYQRAKQKRRDGWESTEQRIRVEEWLRSHQQTPPSNAEEAWNRMVETLLRPISGDDR